MLPFVAVAVVSISTRNDNFEWFVEGYSLLLAFLFIIYYVYALRKYGRWLADNFADLEHKELWQSLLLLACILLVYVVYTTNEGALAIEYLAQVLTLVIIGFVVWRVEMLQSLTACSIHCTCNWISNGSKASSSERSIPSSTTCSLAVWNRC
jgi:hypothetical protein